MALLEVTDLSAGYGRLPVLDRVSLSVDRGQIVAVVGANGAGKSTLLKTISGLLHPMNGEIHLADKPIGGAQPHHIVAEGLLHVAEGRRLFRSQTVAENLDLALIGAGLTRAQERSRLADVHALFPVLIEKAHQPAGALSGGQQQMLAIGQALMRAPKVLMLDEPSLGLAPIVVDEVFDVLTTLRARGAAILLVEQLVERALDIADHAYVMVSGRMSGDGPAASLRDSDLVRRAYTGG
jgi:branched-chain amino acid transport system ATP-binding protein